MRFFGFPKPEPSLQEPPAHPAQPVAGPLERRHLPGVTYVLPKDLPEGHRLDFQHHLLRAVLGATYVAPLPKEVTHILDVATGTGRWAIEMANAFPTAWVVGLDLEAPPPPVTRLPPNYQFVEGNLFAGLPFPDHTFDFVHQRFLVLALPAKQWPFVIGELVRVTRPGGWVELVEGGGGFHQTGPAMQQLLSWWDRASRHHGMDLSLMTCLGPLLQQAGLVSIHTKTYHVPVGKWGKRMGKMLKEDILASLPGLKSFLCQHAQVTPSQFQALCATLPEEFELERTTYDYYVAYGQKPS